MKARLVGFVMGLLAASLMSQTGGDNTYESCFRTLTNHERTSRGIPALAEDDKLDSIARAHTAQMAARDTIYHNNRLPQDLANAGLKMKFAGENVGMGPSCLAIHEAFMDSPGHRANILDRDYSRLGLGAQKKDDTVFVTEVFFSPATMKPTPPPVSPPTDAPTKDKC